MAERYRETIAYSEPEVSEIMKEKRVIFNKLGHKGEIQT